jgi:hypothetical protein
MSDHELSALQREFEERRDHVIRARKLQKSSPAVK